MPGKLQLLLDIFFLFPAIVQTHFNVKKLFIPSDESIVKAVTDQDKTVNNPVFDYVQIMRNMVHRHGPLNVNVVTTIIIIIIIVRHLVTWYWSAHRMAELQPCTGTA